MHKKDLAYHSDSEFSSLRFYSLTALALIYLVIRFGLTKQLDVLGAYSSYVFEIICVSIAVILLGRKTLATLSLEKSVAYGSIISVVAGFGIFKCAGALGIQIPFDLKGTETIFFLLVVAPILEEAIFRFMLWQPIQIITKRPMAALIFTSIAFSYSHLHAIWSVPPEIHNFIIYQTAYTLVLALACGFYVYRYSSLTSAMLIHFGFNFGFYLSSLI